MGRWCICSPVKAFSPLVRSRHAIINRAGFIEAKCFEASNPSPRLAPVTTTVFPAKSAVGTGIGGRFRSSTISSLVFITIVAGIEKSEGKTEGTDYGLHLYSMGCQVKLYVIRFVALSDNMYSSSSENPCMC
jgi:hypothetical protein